MSKDLRIDPRHQHLEDHISTAMKWLQSDPVILFVINLLLSTKDKSKEKRERKRMNLSVFFAKAPNALIKQIEGLNRVTFLQVKESRVPPVMSVPFVHLSLIRSPP